MYKIIICHPCYFNQKLQQWLDYQDEKHPTYITDFKVVKITDFDKNYQVSHYIKWRLEPCD